MTIESDFRFAMFDRRRDVEDLTPGRRGAKAQRDYCLTGFSSVADTFGSCVFVPLRLGVKIHRIVSHRLFQLDSRFTLAQFGSLPLRITDFNRP
jgi:hypothetical protein